MIYACFQKTLHELNLRMTQNERHTHSQSQYEIKPNTQEKNKKQLYPKKKKCKKNILNHMYTNTIRQTNKQTNKKPNQKLILIAICKLYFCLLIT